MTRTDMTNKIKSGRVAINTLINNPLDMFKYISDLLYIDIS